LQLAEYRELDTSNPFGGPVYAVESTASTMEDARALVLSGGSAAPGGEGMDPDGAVLTCGFQTAGRGQGPNRSWTAPPGSSLMFTLCLREARVPAPREALPLRIALGLAWFLEERGYADVEIKWPNDVLLSGSKVAGILCHHVTPWFLVGLGLNVNQRAFPPGLRSPATSLALASGDPGAPPPASRGSETTDPAALLSPLLSHLRSALETVDWRRALELRLAGIGVPVRLRDVGAAPGAGVSGTPGTVVGIGETGALRVRRSDTGATEELFSRDRLE
jgi:biotin-(acetyl-CoA carboxylase) ligase